MCNQLSFCATLLRLFQGMHLVCVADNVTLEKPEQERCQHVWSAPACLLPGGKILTPARSVGPRESRSWPNIQQRSSDHGDADILHALRRCDTQRLTADTADRWANTGAQTTPHLPTCQVQQRRSRGAACWRWGGKSPRTPSLRQTA